MKLIISEIDYPYSGGVEISLSNKNFETIPTVLFPGDKIELNLPDLMTLSINLKMADICKNL